MPVIIATIFMACSALQMKGIYDARSEKEIFLRTLKRFPMESKRKMEELKFYRFLEAIKSDSTAGAFFSILQTMDATDTVEVDSLKEVFYKRKDLETWPDTPDTNEWLPMGRLFSGPKVTNNPVHPYEIEAAAGGWIQSIWPEINQYGCPKR